MRVDGILASIILVLVAGVLLFFAPTTFTLMIIAIMAVLVIVNVIFQVIIPVNYSEGFRTGVNTIKKVKSMSIPDMFTGISQIDNLFCVKKLDAIFKEYKEAVAAQKTSEYAVVSDIAEMINEEEIESQTHKEFMDSFPKIIFILGILGTLISLGTAFASTKVSSLSGLIDSLKAVLLGGLDSYYALIAGIIIGLLLKVVNGIIWETVVGDLTAFIRCFHNYIVGTVKSQQLKQQSKFYKDVIDRLNILTNHD